MDATEPLESNDQSKPSDDKTANFQLDQEKSENEESNESDSKIQILVELGKDNLRPFTLSDCYATDRPGMQLEILPKIIFDTFDEEFPEDDIGMSKPILRLTVDQGTQATVKYKSSKAQTFKRRLVNSWCQYEPRIFLEEEKNEHLTKNSFQSFLASAEDKILSSLTQTKIADIFSRDLDSLCYHDKILHKKEVQLKINGSFAVPEKLGKRVMISSISWHSIYKDIFTASSIRVASFEKRICDLLEPQNSSVLFYMWSVKNQFQPQLILECFDDICILKSNPSLPDVIVGGTLTGQLVLWDIKNKFSLNDAVDSKKRNTFYSNKFVSPEIVPCCALSSIEYLHTFGISYLQWLPSHFEVTLNGLVHKNPHDVSYQVATCGLNGLLQFWDLRLGFAHKLNVTAPKKFTHLDGVWEPFHTIKVLSPRGNSNKSLTCFSFRENVVRDEGNILEEKNTDLFEKQPNSQGNGDNYADFYAGCDDGTVLCGNFKLIKDDEGKYAAKIPNFYQSPHNTSVSFITTSPFIKNVFMSGGGKFFAIWKHEFMSPILLRERTGKVTTGEWSPTKPSLFILGLIDGSVEIWDLLLNIYEPAMIYYVSTSAIKCLSIQKITEMEHLVAVGDSTGVVYTVSLSSNFWHSEENELTQFKEYMEKETNRITGRNPQSEISFEKSSNGKTEFEKERETEEDMNKAYNDFLDLQEQELRLLNLLPKEIEQELFS